MTNLVDQLPSLGAPLLGLFGVDDKYPEPRARGRAGPTGSTELGKPHEFHSYDEAGHAFFAVDRPGYRVAAANDGWERITTFFARPPAPDGRAEMCTYATVSEQVDGSAKGPGGQWFHVTDATVYYDHPVHAMAEHTLNIDLADPSRGPGARLAVELTRDSATRLVRAIEEALASAPEGM